MDVTAHPVVDESSWRYAGWRVVAALMLVEFAIFGFALYGLGIHVAELGRLNAWPAALTSSGATLCLLLGSLLSMFVSDLLRRFGPRTLVLAGVAALAAGLALLATTQTILQFYAGFVVLAFAWVGLGTVTAATIIGAWFDRKRGLAISLAFSGATLSGMFLIPGLVRLVEAIGFGPALGMATAVAVVVLVPVVASIIRFPRAGEHRPAEHTQAVAPQSRARWLRNPGFACLTAGFALAVTVQVAFIVHQILIVAPVIGFQSAGRAVSLTTAMALIGRISLGLIADRVDPRRAAALTIISQAVALSVIGFSNSATALLMACALFGFSIGNLITLPALVIQREFPPAAFGTVLGLSMGIAGVINACGPAAMGLLRDLSGGYATPIAIGVAMQLVAAIAIIAAPRPYQIGLPA
jgi:predicted MFS family arabinose efflux permease